MMIPEPADLIPMLVLLLMIGAFAGVIAGLLGVGGGIILVPAFYFAFEHLGYGSPWLMQICLATSLATIVVTSVRSVLAHHRRGAVDWQVLRTWGPGIALGALAGVVVVGRLQNAALMAIFGVLGVIVGLYLAFGRQDWRLGRRMPEGPVAWVMSAVVGLLSVMMGIGGGSFGVPIMTLFGMPIHRAVATAAGFGTLIAVPSVALFLIGQIPPEARPPFTVGRVNLVAFAVVVAMTMITAPIGVRIAHSMNPRPLRRVFAAFIMLLALNMLRRALGW